MEFQLWRVDPERKRGDWAVLPVDENYQRHRAATDPSLKLEKSFHAGSFEEAMQLVHEYLGLPPYRLPDFT